MDPMTGQIYKGTSREIESLQKRLGNRLVEITPEEADQQQPRSLPARKNWMRNRKCPCDSGRKFKRCCWSKFAARSPLRQQG